MTHIKYEKAIIDNFVAKNYRSRFVTLLETNKGREKFLKKYLSSFQIFFDLRFAWQIPSNQHSIDDVQHLIEINCKQDDCYIISQNRMLDGTERKIKDALLDTIGYGMGTFLYFNQDRKLGYYESEEPKLRFICYEIKF